MIEAREFHATIVEKVILRIGSYKWVKENYSIDAELEANVFIEQIKNSTNMRFIHTSNWNNRVIVSYELF
jgi:hypothetical protein